MYSLVIYLLRSSGHDALQALGDLDLSISQLKMLHMLDASAEELTLKELGDQFALSLPAASRAVEGMHQRSLVERREDEQDRRMKRVRITEAGREIVRKVHESRLSALEQFTATLTDQERRRLAAALAPLVSRTEVAACRPVRTTS